MTLGKESLPEVGENSVLNANYMMAKLGKTYDMAYPGSCMHEFVMTLEILHKKTGVSALDISKGLLDNGIHPPTMYFPQTESKETIDEDCTVFEALYETAHKNPQALHDAPLHAGAPTG